MSYTIKILPEARQDIIVSIDWYNEQKMGLGKLFYQSVKSRMAYIRENPLHYQIRYRNTRSALVNKFPYQVHYQVVEASNSIIVLAITHTSTHPQIWKKRQ